MAFEWDRTLFAKVKAPKKTELDLKQFEELIEKTIVEAKKDIGFKKKKSFSPSSFGGQGGCPVYWKIAFNGAEFKFDPDALGVYAMEAGTHYGDLLESRLLASAVANETQGKIENSSPPIFGYLDFTGTINGVDYVCDIKTVTADKWNKIKKKYIRKNIEAHSNQELSIVACNIYDEIMQEVILEFQDSEKFNDSNRYIQNGTFLRLSNSPKIGWRPDWEKLYK